MTTWICELNRQDVQLLAALIHAYLKAVPDQIVANQLLEKLRDQTENAVSLDPDKHELESIPDRPEPMFRPVVAPRLYYPTSSLLDEDG